MMFDLTEWLIDGYYPDEPTGKVLLQCIDYRIEIEHVKELIKLRKEVEKI